jgi:hypothetical protein
MKGDRYLGCSCVHASGRILLFTVCLSRNNNSFDAKFDFLASGDIALRQTLMLSSYHLLGPQVQMPQL